MDPRKHSEPKGRREKAAQVGLASGFVGIARLVLWDQEMSRRLEAAMSKDQVAVLER